MVCRISTAAILAGCLVPVGFQGHTRILPKSLAWLVGPLASSAAFGYHSRMIRVFSLLLLVLWPLTVCALDYRVTIVAPDALQPLLTKNLPLVTEQSSAELTMDGLDTLVRGTPEAARKLLQTEGYFSARVGLETEGHQPLRYLLKVEPGQPVRYTAIQLQLTGPIVTESDQQGRQQQMLASWPLKQGAVFRQADWDAAKQQALQAITDDRFPLATTSSSQVEVDPLTHQASVRVVIDSGPRVAFGALKIVGLKRYSLGMVERLADFKPGDPYTLTALQAYQAALAQSPQFASAVVSMDLQHLQDGRAPVIVNVSEFPKYKLELGLTYDTDVGPGTRIGLDDNNWLHTGLTASSVLSWDTSQQFVTAGLALPRTADGYVHMLTAKVKQTNIQSLITQSEEIGVWRTHTTARREWRIGLNYVQENKHVVNQPNQTSRALIPTTGMTLREVGDLLHPRSGYLLDGLLSGTPRGALSSTTFARVYGRGAVYWTPAKPVWGTWMARLELGQVWAANLAEVPSSQLFQTGGVNTVRGYSWQSLGVAGPNGSVVGGAVLATASLEYQIPLKPNWALALFTDSGNAASNWQQFRFKSSHGVGVRWFSPVAPISFDFAQPQGTTQINWSMSLGLAF